MRDTPVPVKDTGSQYCAVLAPEDNAVLAPEDNAVFAVLFAEDSDNDRRLFAHFLQRVTRSTKCQEYFSK